MAKILKDVKKITRLNFQTSVFCCRFPISKFQLKNQFYIIITFKMLKIELTFEYARLTKKGSPILASLYQ